MKRTSIEIDQDLLARAQAVLGTSGLKDTVEKAFDEVLKTDLRRQLAEQIRTGEGIDTGPEILEESRRWQR